MKRTVEFKPTLTNVEERKKLAKSVVKNAFSIGKKKIAWVPVELLNIEPYQRNRQAHVTKIAENWDDAKCNVLLVSYDEENGCFNIIDGQHRGAGARMRGVEYLVCEIFVGMTTSEEAVVFVEQNIGSKKLNPCDTYNANQFIVGEDETELSRIDKEIADVCHRYGVIVEKSNAKNTLKSVTDARGIVKRSGKAGLEYVFEIIQDSFWNEFSNGYSGDLVAAIGKLYSYSSVDKKIVKEKLCDFFKNSNPTELVALGNNNYPNLGRRARLDAILKEIIDEPISTGKKSAKVTKIA